VQHTPQRKHGIKGEDRTSLIISSWHEERFTSLVSGANKPIEFMATLSAPNFIEGHQSFQLAYGLGFQLTYVNRVARIV
jgi:hypothetical protein